MENAQLRSDESPEEDNGWPPLRVLCVDDNRDMADSTAYLLRIMGLESLACYSGAQALLLNDSFRPGVCFLDLNMPGMDGDALAVRLRNNAGWRPLLIIAMTAMSNVGSSARIQAAGFDMHLVKPVNAATLLGVVDRLFQAAEQFVRPATE